jgi:AAA+ ATPase superfamily predicted ATPase
MSTNRLDTFIGRKAELQFLEERSKDNQAQIIIVYGRRRVGKTTLITKAYHDRNLIKIEGLEGASTRQQIYSAVQQLAPYFPGQPITSWRPQTWGDFFRLLAPLIQKGRWTLFFEEYQWLSSYKTLLTAELKLAWDNLFSQNKELLIVLCGSAPSFMVTKVLRSKALHNRAQHELHVRPFPFLDAQKLLRKSSTTREAFDGYLLVGGVPEYLKRLARLSSVVSSFMAEGLRANGFFTDEFERIVVSSLADNSFYKKVLKFLSKKRFATRTEIAVALKAKAGGTLSSLLHDLEASGFILGYSPIDKPNNSLLQRYRISDPFLNTYFRFIEPKLKEIRSGDFDEKHGSLLLREQLQSHLGFAFEQYCREHTATIANILGFGAIAYSAGAYFSRVVERESPGYQLDLVFQRADHVHTVCEIKYSQAPVGIEVINSFSRSIEIYRAHNPVSIHRVLISASGADSALMNAHFFDDVIDLNRLLHR